MYRLLLIALAVATSAAQSCYKYCTQLDGPDKDAAPDGCNCTTMNIIWQNFKDSGIIMDDTGVYFEPAQDDLSQGKTITRPFHISNPIKIMTKTKRSEVKEGTVVNKDYTFKSVGHVKEETVFQVLPNKETGIAPSYFDLDFEEKERSSEDGKINLIENLESTERTLVECLDLHLINISRTYDVSEKFKKLLEEKNLSVYDRLSDSDLSSMIREHCSEPEFIVEESLREIKRRVPKKNIDNERISPSTLDLNGKSKTFSLSPSDFKETQFDSTPAFLATTESTSAYFTSTVYYDNITVMEYPSNSTLINSNEIYNETLIDTVGDKTDRTDSTLGINEQRSATTLSQEIFDFDTMPSEISYTTYNYTSLNSVENVKNENVLDGMTISDPFTVTNSDNNTLGADDINYYSTTTGSVLNSENREAVKETEVILPKIITKELNNNTIQTFIDGYETLPNNDFNEDNIAEDSKPIFKSTTHTKISDTNYISGNLYFGSEQELVPIRLTPAEGGKVNLNINGDTLCEKLIKNTNNQSLFLMTLCSSVQSNMTQNNNSSDTVS